MTYGGDSNDLIDGNDGNDFLYGDTGNDELYGGNYSSNTMMLDSAGKDRFVYDNIDDVIFDFQVGTDVIDLAALLTYDPNNPNHDILNFISFDDNGVSTTLNIDANGDGSGTDVSIILEGVTGVDLTTMISDGNIVLF